MIHSFSSLISSHLPKYRRATHHHHWVLFVMASLWCGHPIHSSQVKNSEKADISDTQPSETMAPPPAKDITPLAKDISEKQVQKKLMSLVRQGVAMIRVVSHAGIQEAAQWVGTGFVVDKEKGIIATNAHVAGFMSVASYDVKFGDGTILNAQLIYNDPVLDFAFLKVDPKKLPENTIELNFASNSVELNESIFSVGNSAGEEFSVISGVVYNLYNTLGPFPEQTFQYSGTTVGGASGSPIFNEKGDVVGILYGSGFIYGCALPARYLQDALQAIQKGNTPRRQHLGVRLRYQNVDDLVEAGLINENIAKEYTAEFPHASKKIVCITSLLEGSSAQAVLREGDILWKIDGQLVGPDLQKLGNIIDNAKNSVKLTIIRQKEQKELNIQVSTYDQKPYRRFVVFAGTAFFEKSSHTQMFTGDAEPGVYANPVTPASLIRGGTDYPRTFTKIMEIDGKPLQSLDDLIKIIPSLQEEKRIEIRYKTTEREHTICGITSGERPRFTIVKAPKQLEKPKVFTWDSDKNQWNFTEISPLVNETNKV